MKKFFYSVLAASMLFATSCSHEDIVDITKGEGQKVTFKVNLPEQATYYTNIKPLHQLHKSTEIHT